MKTRDPIGWLVFVILFMVPSGMINGAPIGSTTYIIHTVKNATHMNDVAAKHAWYMELMEGAGEILADDHPDDGMDTLHHVYHHVFNGFSARLTLEQAEYMKSLPCVVALYPDRFHEAQTTHTPEFLGLSDTESKLWPESKYGDDVIIGVIDTGIWPERLSFSDRGLGPIPARWKGACEPGTNFTAANCNNKIIGARYILKGFDASIRGPITDTVTDYKSPLDYFNGHGTHCASTAAGRWAYRASSSGIAKGTARGMAPKARIAVYKVLWTGENGSGGADSDFIQAFDQAVADGVDVISVSIGPTVTAAGIRDLFEDGIAIAAYNAAKKGIFVSAAGGNQGSMPGSIANVAPWMTTVAATTMDRAIVANVVLGNGKILPGRSTYDGKALKNKQIPIVFAGDAAINSSVAENASFCQQGALDASLVTGKILLCNYDAGIHLLDLAETVRAGAVALILANTDVLGEAVKIVEGLVPFPLIFFGNQARQGMMSYITAASAPPMATIQGATTVYGVTPAPQVAGFSARGPINIPSRLETQWLKPDIAAPGVDILAAGVRDQKYKLMSGTSMACPHISGIAALVRSVHPKWSPAAIKSAMMTTATTLDNTNNTITTAETSAAGGPWDFGAGFVQPEKAMNPGLVYDMGSEDYLTFLCGLGYSYQMIRMFDFDAGFQCPSDPEARIEDANLPSFVALFNTAAALSSVMTFNRNLTNVAPAGSTYTASVNVQKMEKFHISVEPSTLTFAAEASVQKFTLTVAPRADADFTGDIEETATVSWSDGEHVVQSPVVVTFYV